MRTANFFLYRISCATLCVTFSANGAAMRKSKSSLLSDRTLEIGFLGTCHRWNILVARWVSFSAVTRMLCAFLIESRRRCNNSVKRAGSSNRWNCSPQGMRERGSANPPYGPGPRYCPALYRVCTIPVRSEVSWILHVESLPLLLRFPTYVDGAWSVHTVVPASRA